MVLLGGLVVTYPLEDLLPSDIGNAPVQLPDLIDNTVNLGLVLALDLAGLANGHVDGQLDAAQGSAARAGEPASHADGRGTRRRETQPVQAAVGGAEGEFRRGVRRRRRLRHHPVVIVKGLINRELDL